MCGIVGGYQLDIRAALDSLVHRGPDANGIMQCGDMIVGHTRLAIIDLDSRANQPFSFGPITLVYNGELWNYRVLREQLLQQGVDFTTSSDTEVVAALLNQYRLDALSRMQGMFALGWHDARSNLFYLARDRFGEAPLHFQSRLPFAFTSELKALRFTKVSPKDMMPFPPGHYAVIDGETCVVSPYYDAEAIPAEIQPDEAASLLHQVVTAGVTERCIGDVPVCTLLSGGIDSTAIAYVLKAHYPNLVAYTAVSEHRSDDLMFARLAAEALDIELREIPIPSPTEHDLHKVVEQIEMPYKAQVEIAWPSLMLARHVHEDGFKVVFSGEGSDELWASYPFAQRAVASKNWHTYRKNLFLRQAEKNFMRCNKVFMAYSIEARLPFLSTKLVELALSLPQDVVQSNGVLKRVLGDAFRGLLPDAIVNRQKVAFQTGLGIQQQARSVVPQPKQFYQQVYDSLYGSG